MFPKLLSKTPVINMHPKIAKTIHIIFFDVIFSLKKIYANINTYMGASDNNTAASESGMLFMDSL